jgi:hypothetical protein
LTYVLSPINLTVSMPSLATTARAVFWNPLLSRWVPLPGVSVQGNTIAFPAFFPGIYGITSQPVINPVQRLAESTRIETAILAAEAAYPDGATAVVLANAGAGLPSPDALSAAGLAGALHAPILLTAADQLSNGVLDAVRALGAHTV